VPGSCRPAGASTASAPRLCAACSRIAAGALCVGPPRPGGAAGPAGAVPGYGRPGQYTTGRPGI